MNLNIRHLQHVGIPVTNLSRSEPFYQSLGFENAMQRNFDYKGGRGTVVMMKRGSIMIELYQFPDAGLEEIRSRRNGHIDHIAFDVENIEETYAVLKQNGFTICEDAPVFLPFWNNGCRYFNIEGPDGERLEFNQIL